MRGDGVGESDDTPVATHFRPPACVCGASMGGTVEKCRGNRSRRRIHEATGKSSTVPPFPGNCRSGVAAGAPGLAWWQAREWLWGTSEPSQTYCIVCEHTVELQECIRLEIQNSTGAQSGAQPVPMEPTKRRKITNDHTNQPEDDHFVTCVECTANYPDQYFLAKQTLPF